jgi:hypothetical protein
MHKTISSRLAAHFHVDGGHLHRYLERRPAITKSLCEDLILHDQILIPVPDYLTAAALLVLLGENGFIELLEQDRLKFIRTRGIFGFFTGKGESELGIVHARRDQHPTTSPIEQSVHQALTVIGGRIKDKDKLHEMICRNSSPIEWTEILEAVKLESMRDLRGTELWKPEFESSQPGSIILPKSADIKMTTMGPNFNPRENLIDSVLGLALYNSDIYLAKKFDCQDISPFFSIEDLLSIKSNRLSASTDFSGKFWKLLYINGIPDFSSIDLAESSFLKDLLRVSTNKNSQDFRNWFHGHLDLREEDILREYVNLLKDVPWIQKSGGKVLRIVITTIAGLLPDAGIVTGPAASLFDSFLVERLLKGRGPKFFIDDLTRLTGDLRVKDPRKE